MYRTLFLFVLLNFSFLHAETTQSIVSKQRNKNSIGFIAKDVESGKIVASFQSKIPLKPASVMKLIPSIVSMNTLTPDKSFTTEISAIKQSSSHVQQLVIKGGGDPNLRTEDLLMIARRIKLLGIKQVDEILIDDSYFPDPIAKRGQRAYQTGTSGLAYNFNSIKIVTCPDSSFGNAIITQDPWEQPVDFVGTVKTSSKKSQFSIDALPAAADKPYFCLLYTSPSPRD